MSRVQTQKHKFRMMKGTELSSSYRVKRQSPLDQLTIGFLAYVLLLQNIHLLDTYHSIALTFSN
jgi:hypothetical protein